jgi:hypothetical protein
MMIKCGSGYFNPNNVCNVIVGEAYKNQSRARATVFCMETSQHNGEYTVYFPNQKSALRGTARFVQKCNIFRGYDNRKVTRKTTPKVV